MPFLFRIDILEKLKIIAYFNIFKNNFVELIVMYYFLGNISIHFYIFILTMTNL